MIVVDASLALAVLFRTPAGVVGERELFAPGETLHAPHVIDVEIAQVLRRYARTSQIAPARLAAALSDWTAFRVTRYPHDWMLGRIWALRDNITAYDAAYIALAEAMDAPLLTCDARLTAAPGHTAKVRLI